MQKPILVAILGEAATPGVGGKPHVGGSSSWNMFLSKLGVVPQARRIINAIYLTALLLNIHFACMLSNCPPCSGFRKRGLANGVSSFFLKMKRKKTEKKEENGKNGKRHRNPKKQKTKKKTAEKAKNRNAKKRKKTEENKNIGKNRKRHHSGDPFCEIPTCTACGSSSVNCLGLLQDFKREEGKRPPQPRQDSASGLY